MPIANKTCIVNVMTNGRVILSDTITLTVQTEIALLTPTQILSTTQTPYSNTVGIVSVNNIDKYKINSLEMVLWIDPPDVAEIDTLNVKIDKTILPDASVKAGFNKSLNKYIATITSSSLLASSPVIPFLYIPLHYFVAKDSTATLRVLTRSPEKDGCVNFVNDSIVISSSNGCGDPILRNFLSDSPLLKNILIAPNPSSGDHITISFLNAGDISLLIQISDMTGRTILCQNGVTFIKGKNTIQIAGPGFASGQYVLQLIAKTIDGHIQNATGTFIISH